MNSPKREGALAGWVPPQRFGWRTCLSASGEGAGWIQAHEEALSDASAAAGGLSIAGWHREGTQGTRSEGTEA